MIIFLYIFIFFKKYYFKYIAIHSFSVHRIYQHSSRDRRHGDRQLETDGRQPSPPHCRGLQGPGQPTDASHGTSQEEGQVIFLPKEVSKGMC